MLKNLEAQPADSLLALIKLHRDDPREDKIDLGVGVYRTAEGRTPVFAAIKRAEQVLLETQESKSYLGPEGDMGFVRALMPIIFGSGDPDLSGRIGGMQTPGGTGAVRLALALAKKAGIKRVWMGTPSWPNHAQIVADLDLELATFVHARTDGTADFDALKNALEGSEAGDAILLHGCCHNPSGIDYNTQQWDELARLLSDGKVLPVIDVAYQGLGQGLEQDVYGLRRIIEAVPEALVPYSCDKNFGMYRDRVGAVYVLANAPDSLDPILSNGHALARASWSMPPDHGGAAVRVVLEDPTLTTLWQQELADMRDRMQLIREQLLEAGSAGAIDLAAFRHQSGLFTILPLSPSQVARLRDDHGIYMAGSGRINVAGLTLQNIEKFIAGLTSVSG